MKQFNYKRMSYDNTVIELESDWIQVHTSSFFPDSQPHVKAKITVGGDYTATAHFLVKHAAKSNSFELSRRFEETKSLTKCVRWLNRMLNSCPDYVKV